MIMAMYLRPPIGVIPLEKLCHFIMKRLTVLYHIHPHSLDDISKIIIDEKLAEDSDCMIEGTVNDKITHFILRLLCCSDSELEIFFIKSETKLFDYRLIFCDIFEIDSLLTNAFQQADYLLSNVTYLSKDYKIILKSVIEIASKVNFAVKNDLSFIKVNFRSALKFVKERVYELHNGVMHFPLQDIKKLLSCIFEELTLQGIRQTKSSLGIKRLHDPQIQLLLQIVKKFLSKKSDSNIILNKRIVNENNIKGESKTFPLCMQVLYNELSKHHRLSNPCRVQFILYLKEIGVSCNDVIKLFKKEYSHPVCCSNQNTITKCSHDWDKNEKRYIYSIEHLFGKKGSCKNYQAHSCASLLDGNEGRCPFTFDNQHLQNILQSQHLEVNDIEDIMSYVSAAKYHEACTCYLMKKVKGFNKNITGQSEFPITNSSIDVPAKSHLLHSISSHWDNSFSQPFLFKKPSEFYFVLSHHISY